MQKLLATKAKVRALFEGRGKTAIGPTGTPIVDSSSGYDYSLAYTLALIGVTEPSELATALWHRPDGRAQRKGREYISRTVTRALERAEVAPPESQAKPSTLEAFDGGVLEGCDHYYTVGGKKGDISVLSNFRIEPTAHIRSDEGEIIVGDIIIDRGRSYRGARFAPSAWVSKRSFLQSFPTVHMQWVGADEAVQGVLRILTERTVPTRTGTNVLGYHRTSRGPRWVTPDAVIGPEGLEPESEMVFLDSGGSLTKRVRYRVAPAAESRALAQQVLPELLRLNEPSVVLPVLGWFFATPFKPLVMERLGHFPILMVWGTQGSGKSTLVRDIFWRLFGIHSPEPFSATQTEFALIRLLSSTNAVPVFLDEYKPSDMPPRRLGTLQRCLRRVYGGEDEERGRPDLSVSSFRLSAPVVLAGEARPDDAALADRLISVMPNKNRLLAQPAYRAACERLRRLDLGLLTVPYIQFALARETPADFEAASQAADAALAATPHEHTASARCRDNLCVIAFGLMMFREFAAAHGIEALPELDIAAALRSTLDDLMDGDVGAKNMLDDFIETCSVLAYNGTLKPDLHYALIDDLVCIQLRACWEIFLEHRRRTGQADLSGQLRGLRRLLRENHERGGYIKDLGKQIQLGDCRPRLIAVHLDEASSTLELSEFPFAARRTWGGIRAGSAA